MYDGSIYTQKKVNGDKVSATKEYSVELVFNTYYKRRYRNSAGDSKKAEKQALSQKQNCTGIHIHLDGADHTPEA